MRLYEFFYINMEWYIVVNWLLLIKTMFSNHCLITRDIVVNIHIGVSRIHLIHVLSYRQLITKWIPENFYFLAMNKSYRTITKLKLKLDLTIVDRKRYNSADALQFFCFWQIRNYLDNLLNQKTWMTSMMPD